MSRSDRLGRLTLALTLIAVLAIAYGLFDQSYLQKRRRHYEYQIQAQDYQRRASQDITEACVGIADRPASFRACIQKQIEAYDANQRGDEDLRAQQDMALWAFWSLLVSSGAVCTTILGIYYVKQTLEANKAAVDQARLAVDIAARAHMAESEPFLILKPRVPDDAELTIGKPIPSDITFEIENTGKGAAVITALFRAWQVVPENGKPIPVRGQIKLGDSPELRPWGRKPFSLAIGPTGRSPTFNSLSHLHGKAGLAVMDGSWVCFVGYIEYEDATGGTTYQTGFCYVWRPDLAGLGLHVAFHDSPEEYWYHERCGAQNDA